MILATGKLVLAPSNLKYDNATFHKEPMFFNGHEIGVKAVDKYENYHPVVWMTANDRVQAEQLKKNAAHTPLDESTMVGEGSNWSDYHITFTGEAAKEVCGEKKWRVVRYFDTIEDRWFEFITNDFDSPAETHGWHGTSRRSISQSDRRRG